MLHKIFFFCKYSMPGRYFHTSHEKCHVPVFVVNGDDETVYAVLFYMHVR